MQSVLRCISDSSLSFLVHSMPPLGPMVRWWLLSPFGRKKKHIRLFTQVIIVIMYLDWDPLFGFPGSIRRYLLNTVRGDGNWFWMMNGGLRGGARWSWYWGWWDWTFCCRRCGFFGGFLRSFGACDQTVTGRHREPITKKIYNKNSFTLSPTQLYSVRK